MAVLPARPFILVSDSGTAFESLAQRVTALTFELRLQFREAIRVKVGSYSWKCAVWINRHISVLLRSERVCGERHRSSTVSQRCYDPHIYCLWTK